jgi:3-methylcrotonyl-CoA carboxylase alpha subunit
MDEATRADICAAAVRAAQAVDYEGAGTIEFIADASEGLRADRIFFMEMNTRLQVEHPVTEEITGVDLVEWQLRVASGEPVPLKQEELSISGHAIEARLYAEDPAKGFLPSTGRLEEFYIPTLHARVDTGVEEGSAVSPYYDPMIAKLIVHAPSRTKAIVALQEELDGTLIHPVKTNSGFLWRCLDDVDFQSADLDTGLIGRRADALLPPVNPTEASLDTAAAAEALSYEYREDTIPGHKARSLTGFRLNSADRREVHFLMPSGEAASGVITSRAQESDQFDVWTRQISDGMLVVEKGQTYSLGRRSYGAGHHHAHDGDIIAPMPGKVIAVDVAEGDSVTAGQRLMVLEAMKMEHALTAPFDGTVTELSASAGAQVQVEALLAVVEPAEE